MSEDKPPDKALKEELGVSVRYEVKGRLEFGEFLVLFSDDYGWDADHFVRFSYDTVEEVWTLLTLTQRKNLKYRFGIYRFNSFHRFEENNGRELTLTSTDSEILVKNDINSTLHEVIRNPDKTNDIKTKEYTISPISKTQIVVMYFLPVIISQDNEKKQWIVEWNYDQIPTLKFPVSNKSTVFLGRPRYKNKSDIRFTPSKTEFSRESLDIVLRKFNSIAVYPDERLHLASYNYFGRQVLRKLMHNTHDHFHMADAGLDWKKHFTSYTQMNQTFCKKILQIANTGDVIWIQIHDAYELLLLPSFVARKLQNRVYLGVMINTEWPSSDIYVTIVMRQAFLRALLAADQIGFYNFHNAKKFISCCHMVLGATTTFNTKTYCYEIEYLGRTIKVTICARGINTSLVDDSLKDIKFKEVSSEIEEKLNEEFGGDHGKYIVGIDQLDGFSGLQRKFDGYYSFIKKWPTSKVDVETGKIKFDENFPAPPNFVQIIVPIRTTSPRPKERAQQVKDIADLLNSEFEKPKIVIIEKDISYFERLAYFSKAYIMFQAETTPSHSLYPYEFIRCHSVDNPAALLLRNDTTVISYNVDAIQKHQVPGQMLREIYKHPEMVNRYFRHDYLEVMKNTFSKWVEINLREIKSTKKIDEIAVEYLGLRLSNLKTVGFRPTFSKLDFLKLESSFEKSNRRFLFFDYTGTIVPGLDDEEIDEEKKQKNLMPSELIIKSLKQLCADDKNIVFIISERSREELLKAFGEIENLGLVAEHGFYLSFPTKNIYERPWKIVAEGYDNCYLLTAKTLMEKYSRKDNIGKIKIKGSTILWDYSTRRNDYCIESIAKRLTAELKYNFKKWPVEVFNGKSYVDVHLRDCAKDKVCQKVIESYGVTDDDFIFCLGDGASDEQMFQYFLRNDNAITVVVGFDTSVAKYYLDERNEVETLFGFLGSLTEPTTNRNRLRLQPNPDMYNLSSSSRSGVGMMPYVQQPVSSTNEHESEQAIFF